MPVEKPPPFADWTPPTFADWTPPTPTPKIDPQMLQQIRDSLQQDPVPVLVSQGTGYQKVVSGTVTPPATINISTPAGVFTVSRTSAGKWTVTFSSGLFSLTPAIVLNYVSLTNGRFITYGNASKAGFDVEIYDPGGANVDEPFSFVAQGS